MAFQRFATAAVACLAAMGSAAPVGNAPDDLVFQGEGQGLPLLALIETAREVTGEPFFYEPKDVKDQSVFFTGTVTVPRDQFLPFFDWCLRQVDFVHLEQPAGGVTLHRLQKLGQQARGLTALKAMARGVTVDELRAMRDRGTLVTTTYTAKHLPARELVTTLQLYFADSATDAIRNIEGTNSIVMTGFASSVAAIVDLSERLDAVAPADPEFVQQRALDERVKRLEAQVRRLEQPEAKQGGK